MAVKREFTKKLTKKCHSTEDLAKILDSSLSNLLHLKFRTKIRIYRYEFVSVLQYFIGKGVK